MMSTEVTCAWIALDWGSSRARAWAISDSGETLDRRTSDEGAAQLRPGAFPTALFRLVEGWRPAGPIMACGMVGAREGWVEAPYADTPGVPLNTPFSRAATEPDVFIVPGLRQTDPPDVMRGEETQIAGFCATHPGWDGLLCLPGTHTKWARVADDRVLGFRTFMTGELFALLGEHSVLRHSVGDGWDEHAFAAAAAETAERPEQLAAGLFGLRAAHLLRGAERGTNRARLSGLLVGAELAAARRFWGERPVTVVGETKIGRLYATALEAISLSATLANGEAITLAGLSRARHSLTEDPL